MIDEAKTILENHSKQFNSMHTFNTLKWLGETVLAWVRTMKYELFGFIKIDNQTITFSSELNMRKIREGDVSIFWDQQISVISIFEHDIKTWEWIKITFHNDPEGRSDTGALNYATGNRPGGGKSTTWCSADLRTASKEANYPVANANSRLVHYQGYQLTVSAQLSVST